MPADIFGIHDGKTLLVGLTGGDGVQVFDVSGPQPKVTGKILTGKAARAFRAAGDGRAVFVSNRVSNSISRIDLQTLKVMMTIRCRAALTAWTCLPTEDAAGDLALGQEARRGGPDDEAQGREAGERGSLATVSGHSTMPRVDFRRLQVAIVLAACVTRASPARPLNPLARKAGPAPGRAPATWASRHCSPASAQAPGRARDLLRRRRAHADRWRRPRQPLGRLVWKAPGRRAAGSDRTHDHVWRGDEKSIEPRFRVRPSMGAYAGREFTWTAARYCENITKAADRVAYVTGKKPLPLFRAPGGEDLAETCSPLPKPVATSMKLVAGRFPGRRTAERNVQQREAARAGDRTDPARATSCWRTWASGRARIRGRRPTWSRGSWA